MDKTAESVSASLLFAQIYFVQGRVQEAIPKLEGARDLARKLGLEGQIRSQLSASLAQCYSVIGALDRANTLWMEALAEGRRSGDVRSLVVALCGRAETLVNSNPEEAIKAAHDAVFRSESAGPDLQAMAYGSLSTVLIATGHALEPDTLGILQRAIAAAEQAYGPQHPILAGALRTYAILLRVTGHVTEGDAVYRRAQDIVDARLGPQSAAATAFRNEYETMLASANATPATAPPVAPGVPSGGIGQPAALTTSRPKSESSTRRRSWLARWKFTLIPAIAVVLAAAATPIYVRFLRTAEPLIPRQWTPGAPVGPPKPTPPEWGVEISADKTLEPVPLGAPSAEWEPVRASRAGYPNAAIFHKGTLFVTIIGQPDFESARNLVSKLRDKPPYEHWNQAEVVHITQWCPNPVLSKMLTVAEAAMNVYTCDSGNLK